VFSTKNFKRSAVSLFMAIVLFAGTGLVTGQDGSDVWKDGATGLTWAAKDNGMAVTPAGGGIYCDSLTTGGLSNWRLPTIEEVETVYDRADAKQYKTRGIIELSDACVLTASTNPMGETWTFCFNTGSRNLGGGSGCGTTALALCVSGEMKPKE
jgi:hypothetical protein